MSKTKKTIGFFRASFLLKRVNFSFSLEDTGFFASINLLSSILSWKCCVQILLARFLNFCFSHKKSVLGMWKYSPMFQSNFFDEFLSALSYHLWVSDVYNISKFIFSTIYIFFEIFNVRIYLIIFKFIFVKICLSRLKDWTNTYCCCCSNTLIWKSPII